MQTNSYAEILLREKEYLMTAKSAKLVYVKDTMTGITRIRRGKGYSYYYESEKIEDKDELKRINALVIPPAWKNVWICPKPKGHLQATGYDEKNRKQYKYHQLWSEVRNETKFHRLYAFGKNLPKLRARVDKDLRKRNLMQEKVLAIAISVMERTYIRIGNEDYQKLYGSYGITTFRNKHVKVEGQQIRISFIGKKSIPQKISLKNRRLAKAIKQCKEIPGRELFQYYDEEGNRRSIDSGMVNDYIREATGADFTAKDFRTWAGTLNMLISLKILHHDDQNMSKKILRALDEVSQKLGNTRAICKKYYVHPGLIRMYEENNLEKYLKEIDKQDAAGNHHDMNCEEKVLLKVLKKLLP